MNTHTRLAAAAVGLVASLALAAVSRGSESDRAAAPAGTDSTYHFVHPDSLPLYRTYDRRYIREDTLAVPFTYIYRDEVHATAERVSLEEILHRCIEAEKHRYDDVEDISYRVTEKAVLFYGDPDDPLTKRTIHDEVKRVYRKQPDYMRTVSLSEREYTLVEKNGKLVEEKDDEKKRKDDGNIEIDVGSTREGLAELPFFFEDLSDYDFGIEERVDLEDRVLYRISFTPRSDFDPLPTGEFWIDTTDFRIIHTDLRFTENVPLPILLKGIEYASIEMKRVHDHWVYDRIAARVRLRKIPFVPIPPVIDIVVVFDDYAIDQGLSLEVFGEKAR